MVGFLIHDGGWVWGPAFMTKLLSMDMPERAMARRDAGERVRRIADVLSVTPSGVVKWLERRRATGSVAPGKVGGHVPRKIRGEHEVWLRTRRAEGAFTLRGLVANWPGVASR